MEPSVRKMVERVQAVRPVRVDSHAKPVPSGAGCGPDGSPSRCREHASHVELRPRRHRPDALRDAGGARQPAGRGVPRARRAHADGGVGPHRPDRRRPCRRCCCGTAPPPASASSSPTTSACSSRLMLVIVGILTHPVLVAGRRARRPARRRVLRAGAVRDRRHDDDGDGHRPAGHLHRARDPVARGLRAHRHPPRQRRGTEAAFKYFLLGAFSSAFFLYGIAFTYGVTGSTRLQARRRVSGGAVDERQPDDPGGAGAAAGRLRASRSRRCRSTCGRPTPTRARRPWSPASCPPA